MLFQKRLHLGGVNLRLVPHAERRDVLPQHVTHDPWVHLHEVRLGSAAAQALDADGARPGEQIEPTRVLRRKRDVAARPDGGHDHVERRAAHHAHHRPRVQTGRRQELTPRERSRDDGQTLVRPLAVLLLFRDVERVDGFLLAVKLAKQFLGHAHRQHARHVLLLLPRLRDLLRGELSVLRGDAARGVQPGNRRSARDVGRLAAATAAIALVGSRRIAVVAVRIRLGLHEAPREPEVQVVVVVIVVVIDVEQVDLPVSHGACDRALRDEEPRIVVVVVVVVVVDIERERRVVVVVQVRGVEVDLLVLHGRLVLHRAHVAALAAGLELGARDDAGARGGPRDEPRGGGGGPGGGWEVTRARERGAPRASRRAPRGGDARLHSRAASDARG